MNLSKLETTIEKDYFLDKIYPIQGRKDFFKYVIQTPQGLAKDFKGNPMYFDEFAKDQAERVLQANRNVAKLNYLHINKQSN